MSIELAQQIEQIGKHFELTLSRQQCQDLAMFHVELMRWAKVINLTSVYDSEGILLRHIADCMSVVPYLQNVESIVDVGSGAGLPGVVLAVLLPQTKVFSVEKVQKKVAFQYQIQALLRLGNFFPHAQRLESLHLPSAQVVISRAFASIHDFVTQTPHLLQANGRWFAMKGKLNQQELQGLPNWARLSAAYPLLIPGLSEDRNLFVIERVSIGH